MKPVWVLPPHAHAVAKVDHPVEQGFVAIIDVFIDTSLDRKSVV